MMVLRLRAVSPAEYEQFGSRTGFIYFIRDVDHGRVKVGFSRDPWARLRQLQTGSSGKLEIAGLIGANDFLERVLHREIAAFSVRGEWFSEAGAMGWLMAKSNGHPMSECIADLVDKPTVQVWYQWDAAAGKHIRHVYNSETNGWVSQGHVDDASARRGWDSTTTEVEDE